MEPITTSIFDMFKIGPGPSSSHTIGPMKAGYHFLQAIKKLPAKEVKKATAVHVHLFGSLSATGKGHGTDRAVTAGLLGWLPDTCDDNYVLSLLENEQQIYNIKAHDLTIPFTKSCVIFDSLVHSYPFSNTMIIKLMDHENVLFEKEYYSTGGGFLQIKGELPPHLPEPKYKYGNMKELKAQLAQHKIGLSELVLQNEETIHGHTRQEIFKKLDQIIDVMEQAVEKGIATQGVLPGPIKLERKAPTLYAMSQSALLDIPDKFLVLLDAYALAASEENAACRKVVTAPTSGSAGVIPALICLLKKYFNVDQSLLREGLLAAAAIGFIIKKNASISGAEVGCQGEVGAASSMGAGLIAHVDGKSIDVVENAAEIAMEHQLGLTCDPIGGYVQIPCIERNAVGAVNAYNAYILASCGDPKKQKISFDMVVKVMLETGQGMCSKYKETSLGGLALCDVLC